MNILLLGLNYAPEEIGVGPYTSGLAEALASRGHRVVAVAGKPYYPQWKTQGGPRGLVRSVENGVSVIRCPHFIPRRPSGIKRIVHHLSFAARALPVMIGEARRERPDLVVSIAPALLAAPAALAAMRESGAPGWLHVQDFELEAALATGMLGGGVVARLGAWLEGVLLRAFDTVSTISPPMVAKLKAKGVAPGCAVEMRNWAETAAIDPATDPAAMRAELNLPPGKIALYSGNLSAKQGIAVIADAARILAGRSDLHFLVCGEGPEAGRFAHAIAGLGNVSLRPLQPRERLGELLAVADVHLLPQIAGAADLVLPSKLANMLASRRPVVATAAPGTALADEVGGCGEIVPPGDPAAFASAITRLMDDPALRKELGAAARVRAEQRWSRDAVLQRFCTALENAVALARTGAA